MRKKHRKSNRQGFLNHCNTIHNIEKEQYRKEIEMFKELKIAMFRKGLTQHDLLEILDVSQGYLTQRFNGTRSFTIEHIYIMCDLLAISYEEISKYFPKEQQKKAIISKLRCS